MNDPFGRLPVVPSFTVTSSDVTDGQAVPLAQMSGIFQVLGGKEFSPQLSWSGAPGARAVAVVPCCRLGTPAAAGRLTGTQGGTAAHFGEPGG
jgi:hypothetical protein